MSDPADATNTMPLQQIRFGGEDLWEKVKRAKEVKKARERAVKVEVHVHLHGKDSDQ